MPALVDATRLKTPAMLSLADAIKSGDVRVGDNQYIIHVYRVLLEAGDWTLPWIPEENDWARQIHPRLTPTGSWLYNYYEMSSGSTGEPGVIIGAIPPIGFDVPQAIIDSLVAAESSLPPTPQLSQDLKDRLHYLASLQENWDGEGSAPVSQLTIDKLSSLLLEAFALGGESLPIPFISPAHDGMLVAEWKTDIGKELILDVPPDETLPGFLLVEPQSSGEEKETDAEIGDEWPIAKVIRILLAN